MAADSSRLNWILSADPSGLKAGCKEAQNSLKDLSSTTATEFQKADSRKPSWKGVKSSTKELKKAVKGFGPEIAGMFGGVGDVVGAGLALGIGGAAVAGAGLAYSAYQSRQEKMAADREKAYKGFASARAAGIDAGTYRTLEAIAGDDAKFLTDMAEGMKKLKDAGPLASESLKKFAADIENFRLSMGVPAEDAKREREQLRLSAEQRLKPLAAYLDDNAQLEVMKNVVLKGKRGMTDDEAERELDKMSAKNIMGNRVKTFSPTFGAATASEQRASDAYDKLAAEYEKEMQGKQGNLEKDLKRQQEADKFLTPRQKLDRELQRINQLYNTGRNPFTKEFADKDQASIAGKATATAISEYRKEMSGGAEMAGAAQFGSVEAYGTIASAVMAQRGVKETADETNAILTEKFDNLIQAVQQLKPNWRTDEGPK